MIIDAHNHLGFRQDLGLSDEDLLKRMDRAGIDMAVCFGHPVVWDNKYVFDKAKTHPDRIIPFVGVDPWKADAAAEVRRYFEMGARGLKLHPVRDSFSLARRALADPLIRICSEFGAPLIAHGMDEWSNTPWHFAEIARRYPTMPIIMAHGGHTWLREDAIDVAQQYSNIYIESSAMYPEYVHRVVHEVSPHRMLMGTDSPAGKFESEIAKVKSAVEDPEHLRLVMGGNIAAILKL